MTLQRNIEAGTHGTIDRIEGGIVVVELAVGDLRHLPRDRFHGTVKEGDVVVAGVDGRFSVDTEATQAARERADRLVAELSRRDPGGDIVL